MAAQQTLKYQKPPSYSMDHHGPSRQTMDYQEQVPRYSEGGNVNPPNYDSLVNTHPHPNPSISKDARQHQSIQSRGQTSVSNALPLPCVIPQISKSFQGAFYSPFARAYVAELESYNISKEDFVAFIDGLNEAFIAHPIFRGISALGGVMTMFYGIHPVQWAGMGLQVASGTASAATSYLRTKAYVKAVNADLFHPADLHLSILTTKKMMAKVGHPEENLTLPSLQHSTSEAVVGGKSNLSDSSASQEITTSTDDLRMRRIRALDGYVMPLDFDVPDQVIPDNLLKKMGAAQADKSSNKQQRKIVKRREKKQEKYMERIQEAEKKQREGDRDVARVEQKLLSEQDNLERKLGRLSPEKQDKAIREFEKEQRKLQKEIDKEIEKRDKDVAKETRRAEKKLAKVDKRENKIANKIRWLVISNLDEENVEEESDVDPDSDE